jgi:hypothetical protein
MLGIDHYYSCPTTDWEKLRNGDLWGASLDASEIVFLGGSLGGNRGASQTTSNVRFRAVTTEFEGAASGKRDLICSSATHPNS